MNKKKIIHVRLKPKRLWVEEDSNSVFVSPCWIGGRCENTAIYVKTLAMKVLQRRHQSSDMPQRHFSLKKDTKRTIQGLKTFWT